MSERWCAGNNDFALLADCFNNIIEIVSCFWGGLLYTVRLAAVGRRVINDIFMSSITMKYFGFVQNAKSVWPRLIPRTNIWRL